MAMIYDFFPFFQEFDLLEIRLNTLKDVVDRFVIVELDYTHSGKQKAFSLDNNLERYRGFPLSYHMVVVPDGVIERGSWYVEYWHREQLKLALKDEGCMADDIVILSDLDEIPNPNKVREKKLGRYLQRMYYFYLDGYAQQHWPSGTIVMSGETALNRDFQDLRWDKTITQVEDGGWHFSSVGTASEIEDKMVSFAHTEYSDNESRYKVLENWACLRSIHGEELIREDIEKLPLYLQENQNKYEHLFI